LGAGIDSRDRVLVTGATGWFGRTASLMATASGIPLLAVSTKFSTFEVAGVVVHTVPQNLAEIQAFAPTVVIDTAFITREKYKDSKEVEYVKNNREIIKSSIEICSMPSVRKYVGFSSGATVHLAGRKSFSLNENPYGALKAEYEDEMNALNLMRDQSISIARVWSVSGAYVTKPTLFAFTDLITQARKGAMQIKAPNKVFRRYCSIESVIQIALSQPKQPMSPIFDTGGELIEIGDLAQIIREEVNPDAQLFRGSPDGTVEDHYYSNGKQWRALLNKYDFEFESVRSQVRHVSSLI